MTIILPDPDIASKETEPMKRWIAALSLALSSLAILPLEADAKRLGGGASSGLKRELPARTAPEAVPAKPATPGQTAAPTAGATAGAAAAAPKRSWLGPVAGLAAGLGLAALASHLGFGEEFGNFMMLALLAVVAIIAIRFMLRRFGPAAPQRPLATPNGLQFAGAGNDVRAPSGGGGSSAGAFAPAAASNLPADFDAAGFERIAKMIFIRMQAANDTGDLNDLRAFTTPEMFATIKLDLNDRAGAAQQTDVVQIDASVVDVATEAERQVVSVRFRGLIREERDAGATSFDEVWHLVKPIDASREWAIAGIQQTA